MRYKLVIEFDPPEGAPDAEVEELGVMLKASMLVADLKAWGCRVRSDLSHEGVEVASQGLRIQDVTAFEPTPEEYQAYLDQQAAARTN